MGQSAPKFSICPKMGNLLGNYIRIFLVNLQCLIIKKMLRMDSEMLAVQKQVHRYKPTFMHTYIPLKISRNVFSLKKRTKLSGYCDKITER